jgi:CopG antitoxin of type II toxin-antitoxin system
MTKQTKENQLRRPKSRIPEFKSREEEARWFDTHDLGDYEDEFKPVRVRFSKNLTHGLTVQLDPNTVEKLRVRAQRKGMGPTQLVRMWVLERLEQPDKK